MSSHSLPALMVAPNGAFRTKDDHPEIPVTLQELCTCAIDCAAAGADGMHFHLRDPEQRHVLDAGLYREALSALQNAVPQMVFQITTEAAGRYDPDLQRDVALASGAQYISASVRELLRATPQSFTDFHMTCAERGITVQHILYDVEDVELLCKHLPTDLLTQDELQLLFVLGRYSAGQVSNIADLDPFLNALSQHDIKADWAVCAFGPTEAEVLHAAKTRGGKCRIGFENSLHLSNGTIARSNADKVRDFLSLGSSV